MQAVAGLKILIPQLASYSCIFISAYCMCHSSVLVISLAYVYIFVQILQNSASLPDPKGQRIVMVVCITCTTTSRMKLQHFSNVVNFPKHSCRRGIFWSQSSIVVMIQPWIQLHRPLHVTISWDHVANLVIGLLLRYYRCMGREIDASQELGLADKTCYTV